MPFSFPKDLLLRKAQNISSTFTATSKGNIHLYLSIAFILLVIIHLTLDWKWIKARATHIFKREWKMALLSTALVSLLLLFTLWIFYPKEPGAYENYSMGRGRQATEHLPNETLFGEAITNPGAQSQEILTVTGQMTLLDLEKLSGFPASRIIEALGLPSNASRKEPLGRLRKKYGFSLVEIRDVLTRLTNEGTEKPGTQTPVAEEAVKSQDKEEEKPVHGRLEEEESGILITGQISLFDIQIKTGIPVRQIADELDLPPDAPLGESLGSLRRRYGFTINEVREIVASMMKKN